MLQRLKQTWQRLESNTPAYFKWLRRMAVILGGACLAALTVNSQFDIALGGALIQYMKYVAVGCAFVAGTATLSTTNKTLSEK